MITGRVPRFAVIPNAVAPLTDLVPHPSRSQIGRLCYTDPMTRDQVKEILDRVLTWPAERQADVAHVVEIMEEQDRSDLRLSEEQAAEVRRRLAEKNPKTITLAEFNERLRRRYGV
jgi:hypothetical protein